MLIEGHFDGEVWGCTMILDEGCEMYITSGDDNTLLLYDIKMRKVVGRGTVDIIIDGKKTVGKKFKGGASSMSKKPAHQQSRGVTYEGSFLNHLAVATNDGKVSIRQVQNLGEYSKGDGAQVDLD